MNRFLAIFCLFYTLFSPFLPIWAKQLVKKAPKLEKQQESGPFTLSPLEYTYDALAPSIDCKTMRIHHDKHHQGYVDKLNEALKGYPDLQKKSLVNLITSLDSVPKSIRTKVRHNGGGHFAHSLFWQVMAPKSSGEPTEELAEIIKRDFGSFQKFKDKFSKAAASLFGSGWIWLCLTPEGKLRILSTQGHDVPMRKGLYPLLVLDVWEHAYYLKYQNRRSDYINKWWNVINWPQVQKYYMRGKTLKHPKF